MQSEIREPYRQSLEKNQETERFPAQPQTIVTQSHSPKGNLLFWTLFSSPENCMHNEV